MTTEQRNPICMVYFGKTENGYYVRYTQPTTGKPRSLTEPSLELLAEDISELNIVKGKGTLLNEKIPQQRLPKKESHWLRNYVRTPKSKQVSVSLNEEGSYRVRFFARGMKEPGYLTLDTLPAVIELLQNQKTPSHKVRRKNLPWRQYAFIISSLEESRQKTE